MGDIFLETNDLVEASLHDRRLIVRFTSPKTRNPISTKLIGHLEGIISKCSELSNFNELVITGTDAIFASGADLREIAELATDSAREFGMRGQTLMNRISELPILTLAAINGVCYGGALDLVLACDRRIASPNATFCHPGAGLGIITGWGGTQRMLRLIGHANACEMFFTAEPISAERALQIGLIDEVTDCMY